MSNDISSDFFNLNDAFKKIADAWNEGLDQAKRVSECKIRRFTTKSAWGNEIIHDGVAYPDGQAVVQERATKAIQVFRSLDAYTDHYRASRIQWIDPEPQGWHFDPEAPQ